MVAHQRDGELAGEQLIEGKPGPCGMHGREVVGFGRRVGAGERGFPVGPAVAREIGGVLPLGQSGRAFDGAGDRLLDRALGQAGGEAVDRLDPQDRLALVERHDVVGMRHLHLALVELDPAAHHANLAHRQQLLQIVLAAVEEGEAEPAGLVAAPDAVGLARIARHQMLVDRHGERGDLARLGMGDLGGVAAVDHGERQVPQQIDDQRAGQFFHELAQPRPDSGQRGHLGEQGRQALRAHGC